MTEPIIIPFKERVRSLIISAAKAYFTLLGTDYIIQSEQFVYRKEYIVFFKPEHFLHLTGVKTKLNAEHFYRKAIKGKLTTKDYDCDSTDDIKRTVAKKLRVLVTISTFFDGQIYVQERFERNRIKCIIGTTNNNYTIGFDGGVRLYPKTLLNGNKLQIAFIVKDCIIKIAKI